MNKLEELLELELQELELDEELQEELLELEEQLLKLVEACNVCIVSLDTTSSISVSTYFSIEDVLISFSWISISVGEYVTFPVLYSQTQDWP